MNIQIFGKSKCFDTKKAERWFKERRIKYQFIDLPKFGMSGKEFDSVLRAVGGIDKLTVSLYNIWILYSNNEWIKAMFGCFHYIFSNDLYNKR